MGNKSYDPVLLNSIYDAFVQTLGDSAAKERAISWSDWLNENLISKSDNTGYTEIKNYINQFIKGIDEGDFMNSAVKSGIREIDKTSLTGFEKLKNQLAAAGLRSSAFGVNNIAKIGDTNISAKSKLISDIAEKGSKVKEGLIQSLLENEKLNNQKADSEKSNYTKFLSLLEDKKLNDFKLKGISESSKNWISKLFPSVFSSLIKLIK